jgi:chromosome segregation ATPase
VADSSETTLTQIYSELQQINERLRELNNHVARQNGRIDHLEQREQKHSGKLEDHSGEIAALMARIAVADERDKHQDSRIGEASQEHKDLRAKVWAIALEVAKIGTGGGIAAVVYKLLDQALK